MSASRYVASLIFAFAAYILALLLALFIMPAYAHDWYPIECCHQMDCAPVDKMTRQTDGTLWVTTKHGTAFVPAEMTRRESQDGQAHACIRDSKVICIFLPPAS